MKVRLVCPLSPSPIEAGPTEMAASSSMTVMLHSSGARVTSAAGDGALRTTLNVSSTSVSRSPMGRGLGVKVVDVAPGVMLSVPAAAR